MGELFKVIYDNWPEGANTSAEPDELTPTEFTVSRNTYLKSVTPTKAIVCKRLGMEVLNDEPIEGTTAIIGQHEFKKIDNLGGFTNYHLAVSDNGRLDLISTAGVLTTVDAIAFSSSTTQQYLPSFADANNLCFIVNGQEAKKFNGLTLTNFGIVAPTTAPTLAAGSGGNHNGIYEGSVTFYNTTTGHESSRGPVSTPVTITNDKIDWSAIPVSADPQVDARRLYLRNMLTMPDPYLVTTIEDNTTTIYTSDLFDSSLTDLGPDEFSNNPPPAGIKYLAWGKSRMFAATDKEVFYSPVEDPESFDPEAVEPVNPDDSQKITGIFYAFDIIIIFKSSSMYAIVGDDPTTWSVQLIDPSVGCIAHRSMVFAGNALYWWGEQGPAKWTGTGLPEWLGPNKINRTLSTDFISSVPTELAKICAVEGVTEHRIVWAIPELGKTRNTLLLPYSHRLNQWESTGWDPVDVASMAVVLDSIGRPYIMLGGYSGQAFRFWTGDHDGIDPTATYSGTFVATATSVSTITDTDAIFPTSGGGYVERKVTVVNSAGLPVDDMRPYITANTDNDLALSAPLQGFTIGATYTYYVGGPAFYFNSAWLTQGDAFTKKRYQHCFVQFRPTNNIIEALVDLQLDYQDTQLGVEPFTIAITSSALWDVAAWDGFVWDGVGSAANRFRVGHTGRSIQLRIQHYVPNIGLDILKFGISGEMLFEYIG